MIVGFVDIVDGGECSDLVGMLVGPRDVERGDVGCGYQRMMRLER
jgi:hypothetical protein